jgi:hypothetical protein
MQTPREREVAFRKDLAELLARHRAEIDITYDGEDRGLHRTIVVTMLSEWDETGKLTAQYAEFPL